MKKIDIIMGVRPDFIRVSTLVKHFEDYQDSLDVRLIHTGQHYDPELSQDLLDQLHLSHVHAYLDFNMIEGVGKMASIMMSYENQIQIDRPELVMVIGSSDSAMACALVAARSKITVAHIDAGLRTYDNGMVEEQNSMLIDRLSTLLFTASEASVINLIREGYDNHNIYEVGNLHADAVFANLGFAEDAGILDRFGLQEKGYLLVTLHHDHILANRSFLGEFFTTLERISEEVPICVVLHPKTLITLEDMPEIILDPGANLNFVTSQNYHDMLKLLKNTVLLITDSQGLQEESSILGVQCLTLGKVTHQPVTLSQGTNTLVGFQVSVLEEKIRAILNGDLVEGIPINGWEGKAGQRITKYLSEMDAEA